MASLGDVTRGTIDWPTSRISAKGKPEGDINEIREALYTLMWDEVGIVRDAESLARGTAGLDELKAQLDATGLADGPRTFNLTWHDWMNLESQILISQAIAGAATAREDSRGAKRGQAAKRMGKRLPRAPRLPPAGGTHMMESFKLLRIHLESAGSGRRP